MQNTLLVLAFLSLPRCAAADELRFPDVRGLLEGARNLSGLPQPGGSEVADTAPCERDPKCVIMLPFKKKDGAVVQVKLRAEEIRRQDKGVTYMKGPYLELRGGPFPERLSLGGYRAIDSWICNRLGGAPHPARVLDSVIFRDREVAELGLGGIAVAGRQSIFVDVLLCQHEPDTAYE